MCHGCYIEYGQPQIVNPKIVELSEFAEKINEFGACHIVIDDWNLEDEYIEFCLKQNDLTEDDKYWLTELMKLPLRERVCVMAIFDGYIQIGES